MCCFAVAEVDNMGCHVGLGRVQPRAKKVQVVLDFPAPTNRRQLYQFLSLAGCYRKFVWTAESERAFLDIKARLATQPILRPPDIGQPFSLAADASDVAIGAVLFQEVDGMEHIICFYSKKLDCHQKRYCTVEKEALGLILAVRKFSVYFRSAPFRMYTDHSPYSF